MVSPLQSQQSCLSCKAETVNMLIDFGPQPPSNRFLKPESVDSPVHPLLLGQCVTCGLIQLVRPMGVEAVRPRYPWLTYNEPEGHLDILVHHLIATTEIPHDARILGLTYKDDTTLRRLVERGYSNVYRVDVKDDLAVEDGLASIETIQEALTAENASAVTAKHGPADVLIARHILEHAHDPAGFLSACMGLVKPGGFIVFEMPDSRKFLNVRDYCFVWEEHITYFTPATLKAFLELNGLPGSQTVVYPYALEDSLVALATVPQRNSTSTWVPSAEVQDEVTLGAAYGTGLCSKTRSIHRSLDLLCGDGGKAVLFGAGHLAAKFINFHDLSNRIEYVIDDHPNKQGMVMPGSRIRIVGSDVLSREDIQLCLLALSPESEAKVISAKGGQLADGATFRSIFSLSPLAMTGAASQADFDKNAHSKNQ
jgi:hypothetical protein